MITIVNRQSVKRIPRAKLLKAVQATLGKKRWDITLCFVSKKESRAINLQHLKHDYATDVIAFDMSDASDKSGDLIVCPKIAEENSESYQVSYTQEICRYAIHGTLHLLGYDDHSQSDKDKMWRKQESIMNKLFPS